MNKLLTITTLLGLSLATAHAQTTPASTPAAPTTTANPYLGGNITREYRASDLKDSYGILDVAIGEIWVLNLPDDVTDVITSREGVLQFNQRGPRVVVGALASSGSYPMLVMTADSVYFFQVRLSASRGGGVRNVVVRADESPTQEQAIPGFPSTAAQPVGAAPVSLPATPVRQTTRSRSAAAAPAVVQQAAVSLPIPTPALMTVPTLAPVAATPTTVPVQSASVPERAPQAQVQVEWRALTNGAQTMLYYRATNLGSGQVQLDEASLTLTGPEGTLKHTTPVGAVQLAPKATAYGQVALKGTLGALKVQWAPTNVWGEPGAVVSGTVAVEALKAN